jgi:phenylacetate-CoA ligase
MSSIQGRDTDVVVTPSGNRLIVHFFAGVLEHFEEIDMFQVEQFSPESIVLHIVPTKPLTAAIRKRLCDELSSRGAQDLKIEIDPVRKIPPSIGGKRRFIISHIKTNSENRMLQPQ